MEGPAFHISSKNTMSAWGRYPSVKRSYLSSFFNLEMETGPNISSGVENRDMRYSNALASLKTIFSRLATILLAVPGGPNRKMLSPAMAARSARLIMCSFS